YRDARPLRGEPGRGGAAQPVAAAGDQRDLALETQIEHVSSPTIGCRLQYPPRPSRKLRHGAIDLFRRGTLAPAIVVRRMSRTSFANDSRSARAGTFHRAPPPGVPGSPLRPSRRLTPRAAACIGGGEGEGR